MTSRPVTIVPYNPAWPEIARLECQLIVEQADEWITRVEHIGSTAIPGISAKPTVDILAAITKLSDSSKVIPRLESIGYIYAPEYEADLPERRYLYKGRTLEDQFHLHIVELNSTFWLRHIAFRDFLCTHPAEADAYSRLKIQLAAQYGNDRNGYTDAKTAFIQNIEKMAISEKQ